MKTIPETIEWRPLPTNPAYEVSNFGDVRNALSGKLMKQQNGRKGYKVIRLGFYGPPRPVRTRMVHQLVLETFTGLRPIGLVSGHLDGNPKNNHAINLRWITPKENMGHKRLHGTLPVGPGHPNAKLTKDQARYIKRKCILGSWFPHPQSCRAIALELNVSSTTVKNVAIGFSYKGEGEN